MFRYLVVFSFLLFSFQSWAGHENAPHPKNTIGLKGSVCLTVHDTHYGDTFGGGKLFAERVIIEHWLEIEASAGVLTTADKHVYPVDLVLKVPFYPAEDIMLALGVGPVMAYCHEEIFWGAILLFDSYFWISHHIGLIAELGYGIIAEHGALNEFQANVGVAYRF